MASSFQLSRLSLERQARFSSVSIEMLLTTGECPGTFTESDQPKLAAERRPFLEGPLLISVLRRSSVLFHCLNGKASALLNKSCHLSSGGTASSRVGTEVLGGARCMTKPFHSACFLPHTLLYSLLCIHIYFSKSHVRLFKN